MFPSIATAGRWPLAALAVMVVLGCDGDGQSISSPAEWGADRIGADRRVAATGLAVDRGKARHDSDIVAVDETRGAVIGAFAMSASRDQRRPDPVERPPVPEPINAAVPPPPKVVTWLLRLFGMGPD
jgi:hypothetical protein